MSEIREVTAAEALTLAANGTVALDVRETDEWDRGHSPLARLLPMSALQDRLAEVPSEQDVLIVCHSGSRSMRVTKALANAGYNAINVQGGMVAWAQAGGDLVAEGSEAPRVS